MNKEKNTNEKENLSFTENLRKDELIDETNEEINKEEIDKEDPNKVEVHFKDEEENNEEEVEEETEEESEDEFEEETEETEKVKFNPFDPRTYIELGPLGVLNEYSKQYQAWYTQREDEPENAYNLFRKYAEIKDITLKEFSKQVDTSLSTIKNYSSKYDWMNRKREKENMERNEEIKSKFEENKEIYKNITNEKLNFIQDIANLRTQKSEQHKKVIDAYTDSFEKLNKLYQSILDNDPINWDDYDKALSRIQEIQDLINKENGKHEKTMTSLINQISELEKDLRPPFGHLHLLKDIHTSKKD